MEGTLMSPALRTSPARAMLPLDSYSAICSALICCTALPTAAIFFPSLFPRAYSTGHRIQPAGHSAQHRYIRDILTVASLTSDMI